MMPAASGVIELPLDSIVPGSLTAAFRAGAAAVSIPMRAALRTLWAQLIEDSREQLPWQAPLVDIGRNHHGSTNLVASLGDVAYFQPGQHGYIARKIAIDRDDAGVPHADPPEFVQGEGTFRPPADALAGCCAIADRIMTGFVAPDTEPACYRVAVQRLKYQADLATLERLEAMRLHSLARWSRIGFRADAYRGMLNPRLGAKGLSDMLALMMLTPLLRPLAEWINRRFGDPRLSPPAGPGQRLVESAHLDERFFSALCGNRDTVCTQVFHDGAWQTLPIGLDTVVVFPGKLAHRAFGLKPVLHRVIYTGEKPDRPIDARSGNVTMLIGAA